METEEGEKKRKTQRPQKGKVGEEMNGVWGWKAKVVVEEKREMGDLILEDGMGTGLFFGFA